MNQEELESFKQVIEAYSSICHFIVEKGMLDEYAKWITRKVELANADEKTIEEIKVKNNERYN